ncbi:MAG: hypothetical protein HFF52_07100 [Lawsonibacter sp.]|nr:hypothetical protein [Lawsonibacter sp.]
MSIQDVDTALAEISHTLEQMLALAELSASDLNIDREAMQMTLERLQNRIDRIADKIGPRPSVM